MILMEKRNLHLLLTCCLFVIAYASDEGTKLIGEKQANDWCIAQLTADPEKMQGFIDFACGEEDCGPIQPGGACFEPDLLPAHANYALNLFYKQRGVCNVGVGMITQLDPSYGNCTYPWVQGEHTFGGVSN